MKLLFCIRNDYLSNFAGDSALLLKTADSLLKKGLSVTINNGAITDFSDYDIIHLFNLTRITETYRYFKTAERAGKPVVLTPIYWDLSRYFRYIHDTESIALWEYYRKFRWEILQGCKMLYPASRVEQQALREEIGCDFPYRIVYSGVSPEKGNQLPLPEKYLALKPYLLCAARICPRKNQLELCRAAAEIGANLILAGTINSCTYLKQCLKYSNAHYCGYLHENQLQPLYMNAELHVLCGFVETPGLANLEAGCCNTNIVSTSEGSAEEYFGPYAHYCSPYENGSVKQAVLSALQNSRQPALKQHIEKNFMWDQCLLPLYESYLDLI